MNTCVQVKRSESPEKWHHVIIHHPALWDVHGIIHRPVWQNISTDENKMFHIQNVETLMWWYHVCFTDCVMSSNEALTCRWGSTLQANRWDFSGSVSLKQNFIHLVPLFTFFRSQSSSSKLKMFLPFKDFLQNDGASHDYLYRQNNLLHVTSC